MKDAAAKLASAGIVERVVTISTNYSTPVQVNGFTCRNCTDVDYAKKHIDPDHPKSGPFDVNASTDPSRRTESVRFGGQLAALNEVSLQEMPAAKAAGSVVDLTA